MKKILGLLTVGLTLGGMSAMESRGWAQAPANDNFAQGIAISGTNVTVTGSNINAAKEPGEPIHAGNAGGASVWWVWTAPMGGSVTITTAQSDFDTLLAVYTGTGFPDLTLTASNDDSVDIGSKSRVTFEASTGTSYHIVVDGFQAPTGGFISMGNIVLSLGTEPDSTPPCVPSANTLAVNTTEGQPVAITLSGSNPCPGSLSFRIVTPPSAGTLQGTLPDLLYVPALNFHGTDSFTYEALNAETNSPAAGVTISVTPLSGGPSNCVARLAVAECALSLPSSPLPLVVTTGLEAFVVLEGSATSPDNEALEFHWLVGDAPFASGAVVTNRFELGCHQVTFVAGDAGESCNSEVDFCVITPGQAIGELAKILEQTRLGRANKRALAVSLAAAMAAVERGDYLAGLQQLHAFQNKVRVQVGRSNRAQASALTEAAEAVVASIRCALGSE